MLKASSLLLLLTLVLKAQLCSPAPISAEVIQPPGPGTEELAPVIEDHSHFIEEKEPVQEKLIPVVAGEALSEESPAEEDIPDIAEEPIFIEDQVPDEADESQEVAPQEPLAVEPSEEKTVPEAVAIVEASPDETTEEVAPSTDVDSEKHDVEDPAQILVIPIDASEDEAPEKNAEEETAVDEEIEPPQQPQLEDPAPEAPIVTLAASEDDTLEENTEEEPAVDVETEPQEQPDLEDPAPEAPVVPVMASEEEASEEKAEEPAPEKPVLTVPDDNPIEEPAALPMTPDEEQSVYLDPAELEIEEAGEGESGPEEHAIIVAVEPAVSSCSCQRKQKETVLIVSSETKEEESPEEVVVAPFILEENAEADPVNEEEPLPHTLEEEEPIVPIPVELKTDEEGQEEPQQSDPEEPAEKEPEQEEPVIPIPVELKTDEEGQEEPPQSDPEEPVIIVAVEPAEEEPEQEETVLMISSDSKEVEVAAEYVTEDEAVVPIILEEDAEVDPGSNEEPFPRTIEEEDSVALVPVDLETEEESQVEPAAEEEPEPNDPVVVVPLDPAEEESELEEQVSPEATDEISPEENTEEEAAVGPAPVVPDEEDPATNEEEPLPGEPEEKESVVLDTEEDQAEGETEPALENPAVIVVVEPTSEEPAPEDPILIIPLEDLGEDVPEEIREEEVVQSDPPPEVTAVGEDATGDSDAEIPVLNVSENDTTEEVLDPGEEVPAAPTEILTEVNEPVPAPAVIEAEVFAAPQEGGGGTGLKTPNKDFQDKATLTEEEPVAPVNRGAVLGVAFFTLMSFIVFGFVWTTISKKLR